MSDSKQRKSGVVLSYVSLILNTLIQLFFTSLLVKKIGQSEYGIYSLVSSVIGYLTILDLGFGNAIIVYTAKYRAEGKIMEEKKLHGMFKIIFVILGILAGFLGIMLYFFTSMLFDRTMTDFELEKTKIMMLILAFNLFVTFVFNIYSSIINAYEKFTFQKLVSIFSSILKPLIMVPLLFLGYKSITMVIVITLVNVFVCLTNYYYCTKKMKIEVKYNGFDKKIFKVILGYSIWLFLGTIVDKVNSSVDNFILGTVCGTAAVSIYAIAEQINKMFINLSTALSGVFLPKITKMVSKKASSSELTDEMLKVGRLQYYVIFLVCTGFILFGKKFILLWAGPKFNESYYVTLLLIIPASVPLIQNIGLSIMQAMNKYKFKSISTFIMAIANVIISIFLAKKYGAIGTATGTAIALIFCNIILINLYYQFVIKLKMLKFWKNIILMSIKLLIPTLFMLILLKTTDLTGWLGLSVYVIIYTILYSAISYFIVMNKYEKSLVINILNKIFRKKAKI